MKRSSVLFTELDRRLSLSNNNQNKRKYKEENKKCRKNRQREKQRDFDKVNNKIFFSPLPAQTQWRCEWIARRMGSSIGSYLGGAVPAHAFASGMFRCLVVRFIVSNTFQKPTGHTYRDCTPPTRLAVFLDV